MDVHELLFLLRSFSIFISFTVRPFSICYAQLQQAPEPTRSRDLWNPFGSTTETPRPAGQLRADEVIVRLSLGNLVGKKVLIQDLPWNPNQDPLDIIPQDRSHFDPNPLSLHNNVTVAVFLGVPYAEPPIAQRRFKPPQLLTQFPGKDPFYAFEDPPSCAQNVEARPNTYINDPYPYRVNEDCLYLNIYTPDTSAVSGLKYSVIVFFHGGNFQTGSINEWPGHVLASRGLVVVTVNYRLGPFGFMSLGDSETGNYGFKDQRAALRFVREHISSFGGDPEAVSIVGHDAGAVSVGLHMLSPLSKNLFRAAAALSGAEVSYHSVIGKPALAFNNTMKLGHYLGCSKTLPQNVWDCIMTRSTNDIIRAVETIPVEYNRYLFMPSVDGKELLYNPYWMLTVVPSGAVNYPSPVPYLTGLNKDDGSEVVLEDRTLGEFNDFMNVDYQYMRSFVLEYAFRHNYTMNREAIAEAIEDQYRYWPDPSNDEEIRKRFVEVTTDTFSKLVTDAYYAAPITLSAHLHSAAGSRTFLYVNNYKFSRENGSSLFLPSWIDVGHDCDLYLLFGFPFMPNNLLPGHFKNVKWSDRDRNASQLFTTIFRQFVYNQNPNFPHDGTWSALQPRIHSYLDFNYTHYSEMKVPGKLHRDYRWKESAFWNEYIPSLVQFMTTTFSPLHEKMRREVVAYQISIGVVGCVLMLVTVLACLFAYLFFERNPRVQAEIDRKRLISDGRKRRVETGMKLSSL